MNITTIKQMLSARIRTLSEDDAFDAHSSGDVNNIRSRIAAVENIRPSNELERKELNKVLELIAKDIEIIHRGNQNNDSDCGFLE